MPADDRVKTRLAAALARQHTLTGWCCAGSLLDRHAGHHFRQALELARMARQVATVRA